MSPGILADVLVAVHVAYVSFVAVGLVLIWLGAWHGWRWVRNPVFRIAHLLAIAIVAGEAVLGIACPLTVWEEALRRSAGQSISGDSFVGRLLHGLIFYELTPATFTVIYVMFAGLVGASLWWIPVRTRSQKSEVRSQKSEVRSQKS